MSIDITITQDSKRLLLKIQTAPSMIFLAPIGWGPIAFAWPRSSPIRIKLNKQLFGTIDF